MEMLGLWAMSLMPTWPRDYSPCPCMPPSVYHRYVVAATTPLETVVGTIRYSTGYPTMPTSHTGTSRPKTFLFGCIPTLPFGGLWPGWHWFFGTMVGRLSSKWLGIQAVYYHSQGSSCSASLWMLHLCCQLILFTHTVWLSCNQHVQDIHRQQEISSICQTIHHQFFQGVLDLLPSDYFYIMPSPQGFTLNQVLNLLPDDQHLWLHAVTNARIRGQGLLPFFKNATSRV